MEGAKLDLAYTDIVSPVDGIVVSRNVTGGQTVASSFQTPTLFLIARDLKQLEVDTNTSEADMGGVKEGDRATFTVDAFPQRVFQGTVTQRRQSPQTVQNVVTYDVVIGVDNSDLALVPGMTASTTIIIDQRNDVLSVPNQALRYVPGGLQRFKPRAPASRRTNSRKSGSCAAADPLRCPSSPVSAMTTLPRSSRVMCNRATRSSPPKAAVRPAARPACRRRGLELVPR